MIAVELVLAAAALLYLSARQFDIRSLYPRPDLRGTFLGLVMFFAAWLAGTLAAAPFASTEHALIIGFSAEGISLSSVIFFAMVNGSFEEIFLLGVLTRGLRHHGLSIAVGIPLLVRLSYHLYQGPLGAVWVLAIGLTFALFYLRSQQLWPAVLAHILWDIVPLYTAGA